VTLPPHHPYDKERDDGQQSIDEEQQKEDGVSHGFGLALTERFRAARST
jgi:hypothetical protein